jgi:hypothetical protein
MTLTFRETNPDLHLLQSAAELGDRPTVQKILNKWSPSAIVRPSLDQISEAKIDAFHKAVLADRTGIALDLLNHEPALPKSGVVAGFVYAANDRRAKTLHALLKWNKASPGQRNALSPPELDQIALRAATMGQRDALKVLERAGVLSLDAEYTPSSRYSLLRANLLKPGDKLLVAAAKGAGLPTVKWLTQRLAKRDEAQQAARTNAGELKASLTRPAEGTANPSPL